MTPELSYSTQSILFNLYWVITLQRTCEFLHTIHSRNFLIISKIFEGLSASGGSGNPPKLFCVSLGT